MNSINFNNEIDTITNNLNETYNTLKNTSSILGENYNLPINETIESVDNVVSPNIYTSYYVLIILLLIISFLGINVFYVISHGSRLVGDVGTGFIGYIRGLFKWLIIQIKNLISMTGYGTEKAVSITTKTAESGLNILEKAVDAPSHIIKDNIGINKLDDVLSSGLDIENEKEEEEGELIGNIKKNGGYCYIGSDNNVGSCMYVDREDLCMSKQIYPTMDLCINSANQVRK
jgi:hypothetical protein